VCRWDGQLAKFMQRLTVTHVRRWVEHRKRVGWGSVYQGRYKSFAVQDDVHLTTVLRYAERNPVRANLVADAQRWRWSSLGQDQFPPDPQTPVVPIATWPILRRRDWAAWVNRPFGDEHWTARTERRLNLPPLRPPRPAPKRTDLAAACRKAFRDARDTFARVASDSDFNRLVESAIGPMLLMPNGTLAQKQATVHEVCCTQVELSPHSSNRSVTPVAGV
jgi:hypothetical protein